MSTRIYSPDEWPLFDLRVSLLPERDGAALLDATALYQELTVRYESEYRAGRSADAGMTDWPKWIRGR